MTWVDKATVIIMNGLECSVYWKEVYEKVEDDAALLLL